ncbi:Apolipoprotein L3 [Labeo rohita]|uniref:Apolipoprotein L3 n=1 Tax=Labeo rohita TaxID=84645 RepID=A0ABQ8LBC4_LABRO|nr:apolipoprotein L3 [Labeo rohita]KAI2646933.1 Apolipoprotein L3 [Labeo rohita]
MASSNNSRRRNSMDEPLNMSDVIRLHEEFIALYEENYHELQECIRQLNHLINTFEKDFRRCVETSRGGGIVGILGGVTTIAGLALAPFTLGASVAVVGVGSVMALGGGVGSGILNFMKMNQQKKLIENVENELKKFQNKITPMTDILNVICEHMNEILKHINKPEEDFCGFIKCAAGASEVLRILRIDDIGEVAAQASKTVRLTTTLTGVFAGIGLVLDILSVIEDNKTLNDMDKLAGNRQIRESELESKAGKFIVEMRKVINQQKEIMDELKKTKGKLQARLL